MVESKLEIQTKNDLTKPFLVLFLQLLAMFTSTSIISRLPSGQAKV